MKSTNQRTVSWRTLLVLSMLFTLTAFGQTPGVIGIKFGFTGTYSTADVPFPTDSTGVVPMTNWNNLQATTVASITATTWNIAQDSAGNALNGITLQAAGVNDGWHTGGTECAAGRLLYNYWKFNNNNSLVDGGGKHYVTFTITNLVSSIYDVYVYINDNNGNYWGNAQANSVIAIGNNVDGGGQNGFNGASTDPCSLTTPFHTATGYGNNVNYVKIPAVVTTSGGVIVVTVVSHGGNDMAVAGIQLVPPPTVAIATSPASETVMTNGIGSFSVTLNGGAAPFVYQWYHVSGGVTNPITDGSGVGATYLTPAVTSAMSGDGYYVKVSDALNTTATSSTATLTVVATTASVVSVKFLPSDALGTGPVLASTDLTGLYASSNWNTIAVTVDGSTQNFIALKDTRGYGSPIQVTTLGTSDGWYINSPTTDNAPITKLLNTFVKGRKPAVVGNPTALGTGVMQFVINNLNNSQTYNAYLYLLDNSTGNLPDIDGGNGVTNYAGNLLGNVNQGSNYLISVNQNPTGPRDSGNYVHLTGLTPTAGAITITVAWNTNSTGDGIGVSGLQVVQSSIDLSPVSIIVQPATQRVVTNTPATFSVSAAGSPINYQWYKIVGNTTNALVNATNYTYTVASVQDSDTGSKYFVVVSNQLNQLVSQAAMLTAGHVISPVIGFLENDQFNTGAWGSDAAAFAQIFPGSPWLANNTPTKVQYLQTFDDHQDLVGNSSERIYGYFMPPVTGNYIFYVASDDSAALWLSTDNTPANVYEIAQVQSWMYHNDWTMSQTCGETPFGGGGEFRSDQFELGGGQNNAQQASSVNGGSWSYWPGLNPDGSITLTAGTPYYIELDHWQGNGGQAASVTYKLASQPDPAYQSAPLLAYDNIAAVQAVDGDMIVITNQPVDATALEGLSTTFSVTAGSYVAGLNNAAAPPIEYQWFMISGGVTNMIAGANSLTYTTVPEVLANSGQKFFCQLTTIAFQTNSSAAMLTVQTSNVKPAISEIGGTPTSVFITWNELLDSASAVNLANYSINGGATIVSATATNIIASPYAATVVTLNIANAVPGQNYTLTANNIKNLPLSESVVPNTTAKFVAYNAYLDFNEGQSAVNYGLASLDLNDGINGAGAMDLAIPSGGTGAVLVSDPLSGGTVTNFTATFKIFMAPFPNNNDNNPTGLGDGISFNFGNSAAVYYGAPNVGSFSDGLSGANVLAVNFKTSAGTTAIGVNVLYGGTLVASAALPQTNMINSRWVDITIQLNANGTVNVDRDGVALISGVVLPSYTPASSANFLVGAACGGNWSEQVVDTLAILENAPVSPALIQFNANNGNLNFSWQPAGGRLQTASSLTGPWTNVGGSQSLTVPASNTGAAFYRVVVP